MEKGLYDLTHCRLLLEHLHEPEKALMRMADAVRPGGWLLVEEWDVGSTLSMDVTDPSAAPFSAALRVLWDSLRKRGIADYYFGRRLHALVEQVGFVDVGHSGMVGMARGGDPVSRDLASALPVVLARGVLKQDEYQILQRHLVDPTFNWIGPIMFSAWGRRPVQVTQRHLTAGSAYHAL